MLKEKTGKRRLLVKLNDEIINAISKKLKTGMCAKVAAESEGINESTFYRWKKDGEDFLELVADKDGEILKPMWNKLTKSQKLKCKFCKSVRQSIAEGEVILLTAVYSHIQDDWRAAMKILARRFPSRWGKKDYMQVAQEVIEKPNKLKEFEDEFFADVPESKMKDIAIGLEKLIEDAKNGKSVVKR